MADRGIKSRFCQRQLAESWLDINRRNEALVGYMTPLNFSPDDDVFPASL